MAAGDSVEKIGSNGLGGSPRKSNLFPDLSGCALERMSFSGVCPEARMVWGRLKVEVGVSQVERLLRKQRYGSLFV